jgi:hypothetical protein
MSRHVDLTHPAFTEFVTKDVLAKHKGFALAALQALDLELGQPAALEQLSRQVG